MDDAPGALVGGHPVPDLHQRELKDPHVDHIARVFADLDPIAHLEGFAPEDERPTGEIHDRVAQRDREAGREQAEKRRDAFQAREPDPHRNRERDAEPDVTDGLAPAVQRTGALDAFVDHA